MNLKTDRKLGSYTEDLHKRNHKKKSNKGERSKKNESFQNDN